MIEDYKKGKASQIFAELKESYVILAEGQYFKGYCILFAKDHEEHLDLLPKNRQLAVFEDVINTAGAIKKVFSPARFNYENLGNVTSHIHWHVVPRYKNDKFKKLPIWLIPEKIKKVKLTEEEKDKMKKKLSKYLSYGY